MLLILTVAVLSIIGLTITGLYPGIIVLLLAALIPIASNVYAKKLVVDTMILREMITRHS